MNWNFGLDMCQVYIYIVEPAYSIPKSHFMCIHVCLCVQVCRPNIWPCTEWMRANVREKEQAKNRVAFPGFFGNFQKYMVDVVYVVYSDRANESNRCMSNKQAFIRISVFIHLWNTHTHTIYPDVMLFLCSMYAMYTHITVHTSSGGAFSTSNTQCLCVRSIVYVCISMYFVLVEYSISFTLQTIGLVRVCICVCVIFFSLQTHQNFPDKVVILHPTRRRGDQSEKCGANTKQAAHTFTNSLTSVHYHHFTPKIQHKIYIFIPIFNDS